MTSLFTHLIDFWAPPFWLNALHIHAHKQTHYLSRPSTDLTESAPSLWSLNSTQATTTNFLKDNPLGRTELWIPIKKLTASLILAAILISLQACGFGIVETVKRGGCRENAWFRESWWTTQRWKLEVMLGKCSQGWWQAQREFCKSFQYAEKQKTSLPTAVMHM